MKPKLTLPQPFMVLAAGALVPAGFSLSPKEAVNRLAHFQGIAQVVGEVLMWEKILEQRVDLVQVVLDRLGQSDEVTVRLIATADPDARPNVDVFELEENVMQLRCAHAQAGVEVGLVAGYLLAQWCAEPSAHPATSRSRARRRKRARRTRREAA
jgi:hypothetical protein